MGWGLNQNPEAIVALKGQLWINPTVLVIKYNLGRNWPECFRISLRDPDFQLGKAAFGNGASVQDFKPIVSSSLGALQQIGKETNR